jgi:hypothetical protein
MSFLMLLNFRSILTMGPEGVGGTGAAAAAVVGAAAASAAAAVVPTPDAAVGASPAPALLLRALLQLLLLLALSISSSHSSLPPQAQSVPCLAPGCLERSCLCSWLLLLLNAMAACSLLLASRGLQKAGSLMSNAAGNCRVRGSVDSLPWTQVEMGACLHACKGNREKGLTADGRQAVSNGDANAQPAATIGRIVLQLCLLQTAQE